MDDLKTGLRHILDELTKVEIAARKLANKNFADIAAGAKGRVQQLGEHPDVDKVHDKLKDEHSEADDKHKAAPDIFAATDPGAATQAAEAHRRDAFAPADEIRERNDNPFTPPSKDEKDAGITHPGDPKFDAAKENAGFHNPDDVDLNAADGTLRSAPNTLGVSDVRKE